MSVEPGPASINRAFAKRLLNPPTAVPLYLRFEIRYTVVSALPSNALGYRFNSRLIMLAFCSLSSIGSGVNSTPTLAISSGVCSPASKRMTTVGWTDCASLLATKQPGAKHRITVASAGPRDDRSFTCLPNWIVCSRSFCQSPDDSDLTISPTNPLASPNSIRVLSM